MSSKEKTKEEPQYFNRTSQIIILSLMIILTALNKLPKFTLPSFPSKGKPTPTPAITKAPTQAPDNEPTKSDFTNMPTDKPTFPPSPTNPPDVRNFDVPSSLTVYSNYTSFYIVASATLAVLITTITRLLYILGGVQNIIRHTKPFTKPTIFKGKITKESRLKNIEKPPPSHKFSDKNLYGNRPPPPPQKYQINYDNPPPDNPLYSEKTEAGNISPKLFNIARKSEIMLINGNPYEFPNVKLSTSEGFETATIKDEDIIKLRSKFQEIELRQRSQLNEQIEEKTEAPTEAPFETIEFINAPIEQPPEEKIIIENKEQALKEEIEEITEPPTEEELLTNEVNDIINQLNELLENLVTDYTTITQFIQKSTRTKNRISPLSQILQETDNKLNIKINNMMRNIVTLKKLLIRLKKLNLLEGAEYNELNSQVNNNIRIIEDQLTKWGKLTFGKGDVSFQMSNIPDVSNIFDNKNNQINQLILFNDLSIGTVNKLYTKVINYINANTLKEVNPAVREFIILVVINRALFNDDINRIKQILIDNNEALIRAFDLENIDDIPYQNINNRLLNLLFISIYYKPSQYPTPIEKLKEILTYELQHIDEEGLQYPNKEN